MVNILKYAKDFFYGHREESKTSLRKVILDCNLYKDCDEIHYDVFAKRIDGVFTQDSEAIVLKQTEEEIGKKWQEIADQKCPGYEYFLECSIIQDMFNDMRKHPDYKSDDKKVKVIIHYAEFDA